MSELVIPGDAAEAERLRTQARLNHLSQERQGFGAPVTPEQKLARYAMNLPERPPALIARPTTDESGNTVFEVLDSDLEEKDVPPRHSTQL
jgi:hypothetical protein